MIRKFIFVLTCLMVTSLSVGARGLDIFFIDVVGGAATLIVTPQGESILIDSGWMTNDNRDAKRIHEALVKKAHCQQIDHCITTHWHRDHFGAIGPLSEMVPIKNFYDRGIIPSLPEDPNQYPKQIAIYKKVTGGNTTVLSPGDKISLKQNPDGPSLSLLCVAANQHVIDTTGPTNPLCEQHEDRPRKEDDNPKSIAVVLSYGDFQFFCGGDITWMVEKDLVCPVNRIGEIDLFMVNHHGFDMSNNPAFLKSIKPTAAVICNGPRKGASARVIRDLQNLPECKGVYQLHWNVNIPMKQNVEPDFIANLNPEESGEGVWAKVAPDGKKFIVTVGDTRNPLLYTCK